MPGTVTLHRVIKTTPEKLYRAFTEPEALSSWLPPYGFICTVDHYNGSAGGTYKMTFINFSTGSRQSFGGKYLELKPGEYIRYTDKFDDANLPGEMMTTVSLKKVMGGTDLKIVQEGIPDAIPVEMCYLGWQDSLDKLTRLVEPQIPDA
jgi:uncharacterized protein YndB with AHSA1/START domain